MLVKSQWPKRQTPKKAQDQAPRFFTPSSLSFFWHLDIGVWNFFLC
jgi:hypothetical protein